MIKFRMFGIHIDQFAILSKSAPLEDLGLGVNLNYKYANKGRIISCSTEFNFLNSAQEKIMILAITCEFEIEENDYKNIHKNEKTIIPKELLEYKDYIYPGRFMSLGMQGSDVLTLQKMLLLKK